ncbi:MAG: putative 2-dehydropantoate 2-reductase [Lentisphaerales bacterium]|nr:putative 2-dehydropantoate 2-reductase [Lentisphaerales bacterium]
MKIAIIGTGAIGGFYGAHLARHGHQVHFLLNSDFQHVQKHGLVVDSPDGSFRLPKVNAYKESKDIPECELIILCLKTTANHLLPDILSPMLEHSPKILTLQNGLGSEEQIHRLAPNCSIFGGLCFIASNKTGPGYVKHINYTTIRMGKFLPSEEAAGISDDLLEVAKAFTDCGIQIELSRDIIEGRWRKLCWNIPFNGLTTVHNQDSSLIVKNPDTRNLAMQIIQEVISTANIMGKKIESGFLDQMLQITDNLGPYKPSMMLDYQAGRPLELEAIYKCPLEKAKAHDFSMPLTESLYQKLLTLENSKNKN